MIELEMGEQGPSLGSACPLPSQYPATRQPLFPSGLGPQPCPQRHGSKSSLQPNGKWVARDKSPDSFPAECWQSPTWHIQSWSQDLTHHLCDAHQENWFSRAQGPCRLAPMAVEEAEGLLSRGVKKSGSSMKEEQVGDFQEKRALSRTPSPEALLCLPRP